MPYEGRRACSNAPSESKNLTESAFGINSPRDNRWTNRLAILIVVLLALGPVMFLEGPAEVARWHQAAAMERWLAGDKKAALSRLEDAIRWAPDRTDARMHGPAELAAAVSPELPNPITQLHKTETSRKC